MRAKSRLPRVPAQLGPMRWEAKMRQIVGLVWMAAVTMAISVTGIASGQAVMPPMKVNPPVAPPANPPAPPTGSIPPGAVLQVPGHPAAAQDCENPLFVPLGPNSYGTVYEKVLDVVSEYFEISYANRYDGRIECFPRVAPGLEQPWRPGSPDLYQRLLATFQSIRHRCFVLIQL